MCSGSQCVWTVNFTWCRGSLPGMKSRFLSCGNPSSTPWMKPQLRDRVPQWNSFSIAETPDDGRLGPKHVAKGRGERNSCVIDGIILCMKVCGSRSR
jgi:hypothetical protein